MPSGSLDSIGEYQPAARRFLRPPAAPLPPLQSVKVLDQLRERIRYLHYSRRTEDAYVHWCRAFIRFHGIRHPADMGGEEVETYLSSLSADRGVSADLDPVSPDTAYAQVKPSRAG